MLEEEKKLDEEIKGVNENKFDKFEMIMSKHNEIPESDNAIYLRPAWENSIVGKFYPFCDCFCYGCNYTVLTTSENAGYITFSVKIDNKTKPIYPSSNGVVFDSVYMNTHQCYSYNVTDPDKDFRIRLDSFSGDPDVYVNPYVELS